MNKFSSLLLMVLLVFVNGCTAAPAMVRYVQSFSPSSVPAASVVQVSPPALSTTAASFTSTPSAAPTASPTAVPTAEPTASPTSLPTEVSSPGVPVTGQAVYAVQQGETMSSIARQHNLTVGQLLLANPGFDRSTILYAGIHLNLPAANAAGPTANISPILGAPGDSVTVTAVGFSPNQLVRVGFGPLNGDVLQIDLTQVSPAGVLNRTYPLPGTATQDGLYVFVVQQADQPTVHAVSNLFTLAGTGSAFESGIPVTGSTSSPGAAVRSGTRGSLLTIFPTTAGAGDKITVTASGFPAGSHADVRITRSDKDEDFVGVIDAVASAAGRIETTIPVPASARFGETWVITVATTDRLVATTVESAPITIDR